MPNETLPPPGRRVIIVGDLALVPALERALEANHRVRSVRASDLARGFADAVADLGGVDLVVAAHADPALLVSRPLVDTEPGDWQQAVGRTLDVVRKVTVLASAPLHETQGQLVFVLPTIAMTGAAGWVPLATAAEATRSWAKSVARQWAASRVGVNCVTTALPVILDDGSTDPVPAYIGVGFTAGIEPSAADVHAALEAITGPLASRLAGATLTVDGGVHMEP